MRLQKRDPKTGYQKKKFSYFVFLKHLIFDIFDCRKSWHGYRGFGITSLTAQQKPWVVSTGTNICTLVLLSLNQSLENKILQTTYVEVAVLRFTF